MTPLSPSRPIVQLELRDSTSICLFFTASKRSEADSGTYCTLDGSSKIAAATARQKSTSNPDHFPWSSLVAKPSRLGFTPQMREPRTWTALSVWDWAATLNICVAARARTIGIILRMNQSRFRFCGPPTRRLKSDRLPDDHLRADRHAVVKVDHVVIDKTKAARRDGVSDRLRLVRAVNTVDGATEIHRARAERIARTAGHEPRQIGLALNHFRRRTPIRPFLLARYLLQAGPGEALAADADAIAKRPVVGLNQVKEAAFGVDNDRARRFGGAEEHLLLLVSARELLLFRRRLIAGLVNDIHLVLARGRGSGARARESRESRAKRKPQQQTYSNRHACSVDWRNRVKSQIGSLISAFRTARKPTCHSDWHYLGRPKPL